MKQAKYISAAFLIVSYNLVSRDSVEFCCNFLGSVVSQKFYVMWVHLVSVQGLSLGIVINYDIVHPRRGKDKQINASHPAFGTPLRDKFIGLWWKLHLDDAGPAWGGTSSYARVPVPIRARVA